MEMSRFQFSLLIILGLVKTFSLSLYWVRVDLEKL